MKVLRQMVHESADYIDDIWLVGKTKMEMEQNIIATRAIFTNLDFIITQPTFTCSKLTIETLEQGVKYVQS